MEGLLVGQTLGDRYEIEEVIGRGGMSLVYRAVDRRLGRAVALKVVSLPASGAEERYELRERLRREAASAARIPPHPNVVQVYDYGTDPRLDLDYIVMELLGGRDLKQALRVAPLDAQRALRILREAARGVAAGHRAGFVHRDVKPANIFLSDAENREVAKILDFGIAKALEVAPDDDLTRTGLVPHSPAYASPEQLRGEKHLSPASDVYQLGLVAYETLAGERPFGDRERERIRAGEPPALPTKGRWAGIDAGVREVVARALRPRAEDRFADAEAFVEALSAAVEGHTVPVAAAAAAPPPQEPPHYTELQEAGIVSTSEELEGAISVRSDPRSPARWRSDRRVQIGAAAALALLGLWGITSVGADSPASPGDPASLGATFVDVAALDEEFRGLQREAAERVREEGLVDAGQDEADEVVRTLVDLNQAWVQGELERHLSHYADRVDFYDAENARRSRIERERGEELERYPERQIVLDGQVVTFPEPGVARALVEKRWDFEGPEERRRGAGRQEYILEREGGRWRVVAERLLETYESEVEER